MDEKSIIIEAIKAFCDEYDLEMHTDYSGRFMYGEECIAISGDCVGIGTVPELFDYIYHEVDEKLNGIKDFQLSDWIGDVRFDSLGLGSVIYFPGFGVE